MESASEWNQHQKISNMCYTLKLPDYTLKLDDQNMCLNKYTLTLIKDILTMSLTL